MKQEEGHSAEQLTAERVINVHTTKPYDWVIENIFNEAQVGRRYVLFDQQAACLALLNDTQVFGLCSGSRTSQIHLISSSSSQTESRCRLPSTP